MASGKNSKSGHGTEEKISSLDKRLIEEGIAAPPAFKNHSANGFSSSALPKSGLARGPPMAPDSSYVFEKIASTQAELEKRVRVDNSPAYKLFVNAQGKVLRYFGKNSELQSTDQLFDAQLQNVKQTALSFKSAADKALVTYEELKNYKDSQVNGAFYEAIEMRAEVKEKLARKTELLNDVHAELEALPRTDQRCRKLSYAFDTLRREVMELETQQSELAWTIAMKLDEAPLVTNYEEATGHTANSYRSTANRMWQIADHYKIARKVYHLVSEGSMKIKRIDGVMKGLTGLVTQSIKQIGEDSKTMAEISGSLGQNVYGNLNSELEGRINDALSINAEKRAGYIAIADELMKEGE